MNGFTVGAEKLCIAHLRVIGPASILAIFSRNMKDSWIGRMRSFARSTIIFEDTMGAVKGLKRLFVQTNNDELAGIPTSPTCNDCRSSGINSSIGGRPHDVPLKGLDGLLQGRHVLLHVLEEISERPKLHRVVMRDLISEKAYHHGYICRSILRSSSDR